MAFQFIVISIAIKNSSSKDPRVFYFFSLIPESSLLAAECTFPLDTFIKSEECGVVEQYKTFQKRRGHLERLAIVGWINLVIFVILTSMILYPVFK